ncbi:MAG TPA: biotin/lipoyl-containing protein [Nitrososphaeraceae archaeon]|jgi:biotin carboxyl carrier protein|nr:biotin/lipoyl-containing protein [Nitrososphaeraceae archaeon]
MKIKVNETTYDIEIFGEKVKVNDKELMVKSNRDNITIEGKTFHLDFAEEGERESSLMIIDGMTYLVSKSSLTDTTLKEIKTPISGKIIDVFAEDGSKVKEGQVLIVLEAMKMEIQIKSHTTGTIKEIKASKGQSVKIGEILVKFE